MSSSTPPHTCLPKYSSPGNPLTSRSRKGAVKCRSVRSVGSRSSMARACAWSRSFMDTHLSPINSPMTCWSE